MANVKFIAVSRGLKGILEYVKDREKTIDSLISGVNCVGETALDIVWKDHNTLGRSEWAKVVI